jgi:hypothetical protein
MQLYIHRTHEERHFEQAHQHQAKEDNDRPADGLQQVEMGAEETSQETERSA